MYVLLHVFVWALLLRKRIATVSMGTNSHWVLVIDGCTFSTVVH